MTHGEILSNKVCSYKKKVLLVWSIFAASLLWVAATHNQQVVPIVLMIVSGLCFVALVLKGMFRDFRCLGCGANLGIPILYARAGCTWSVDRSIKYCPGCSLDFDTEVQRP